jgi:hypothetical protein
MSLPPFRLGEPVAAQLFEDVKASGRIADKTNHVPFPRLLVPLSRLKFTGSQRFIGDRKPAIECVLLFVAPRLTHTAKKIAKQCAERWPLPADWLDNLRRSRDEKGDFVL